jgi:predicted cupin superfamily sugar epimerase
VTGHAGAPAGPPAASAQALAEHLGLVPMPLEGGLFRRTWAGPAVDGRPTGSAIVVLLTDDPDSFSAMHRLPGDEVWHYHLGDPLELLLLDPAGSARREVLGPDVRGGQHVQLVVPAGTWVGGRVAGGGAWTLFGCTMAPGFVASDYVGADADELGARYPQEADRIRKLCRPGTALRHPAGSEAGRPPRPPD